MSEQKMTPKKAFMAILPVLIGIILIVLIVAVISTAKSCGKKTSNISNADEVYLKLGDMEITNERLYVYMKQSYGVSELVRLVDEILFKDDVANVDSADLDKYVNKSLYGVEDLADYDGDPEKVYKDTVKSLLMTGLITEAESTNKETVNAVIKSFYGLQFAREQWAKKAYLEKYLAEKKEAGQDSYFTDDEIKSYYDSNYTGETIGLFIPFTSEDAAYAMMNRFGINTQSNLLSNTYTSNGWVTSAYDYLTDTTINDSQYLSATVVMEKFFNMYNEVYSYQNDGNPIITTADYIKVVDNMKTSYLAKQALSDALATYKANASSAATLPTTIAVDNSIVPENNSATIEWSLEDNDYLALTNNVLTQKVLVSDGTKTVKLTAKVTYQGETSEEIFSISVKNASITNLTVATITEATVENAIEKANTALETTLNAAVLTSIVGLPTKVSADDTTLSEISVTWSLAETTVASLTDSSLSVINPVDSDATIKLTAHISFNGQNVDKEYTLTVTKKAVDVAPPAVNAFEVYELTDEFISAHEDGNLQVKWSDSEITAVNSSLAGYLKASGTSLSISDTPKSFYLSYTRKPIAIGNYYALVIKLDTVASPSLEDATDEIIEKKKEELLTDNNIKKMIYQRRSDANFKIYDNYLEAIYDYEYTYFFETTLSLTAADYDVFENSKKKTTENAASFEVNGETKYITTDTLFTNLEEKYGPNTALTLVNYYEILNNELGDFNKLYNPYTKEVYNKKYFNNLLENEVSSLRKNFELDYFTYSYLSYYGFIPNFPSSYGWANFEKDYFGSFSDEELAASSSFGGTVYSETYKGLLHSLYDDAKVNEEIQKLYDKWFSVDVMNLVVSVDMNYDSSPDTDFDWTTSVDDTTTYEDLAKELAALLFDKQSETGETKFTDAMAAIVKIYNNADNVTADVYDGSSNIYNYNFWSKFKKAGLVVKWETSQTYSWANSPENTADTESSKLMQEFIDKLNELYKLVPEDLYGTTLDVTLCSTEAFSTDYGYHMVAITKATAPTELPTETEIKLYKAFKEVSDNKEATTDYGKDKLAKAEEALKSLLKELGYAEDYTQDEATTTKLTTWYDAAVTAIEGGTLVSDVTTAKINEYITNNKLNFTDSKDLARLTLIVRLSAEDDE